uniref:Uncharacterized protein n=1 Tax=Panagrolaimus sp. JU765 TaxID=591449 RepID=A0AC34PUR7_9BILA
MNQTDKYYVPIKEKNSYLYDEAWYRLYDALSTVGMPIYQKVMIVVKDSAGKTTDVRNCLIDQAMAPFFKKDKQVAVAKKWKTLVSSCGYNLFKQATPVFPLLGLA